MPNVWLWPNSPTGKEQPIQIKTHKVNKSTIVNNAASRQAAFIYLNKRPTSWGGGSDHDSASTIFGAFAGESERHLRDAFAVALKDTCVGTAVILFIDEIDALCPKRDSRWEGYKAPLLLLLLIWWHLCRRSLFGGGGSRQLFLWESISWIPDFLVNLNSRWNKYFPIIDLPDLFFCVHYLFLPRVPTYFSRFLFFYTRIFFNFRLRQTPSIFFWLFDFFGSLIFLTHRLIWFVWLFWILDSLIILPSLHFTLFHPLTIRPLTFFTGGSRRRVW